MRIRQLKQMAPENSSQQRKEGTPHSTAVWLMRINTSPANKEIQAYIEVEHLDPGSL